MSFLYKILGDKMNIGFRSLVTFLVGFPLAVLLLAGLFFILKQTGIL